jgi:hypothetical protein
MPCLYAIFSHTNPSQVRRLAHAIRNLSPTSIVVIHHDPSHTAFPAELIEGMKFVYLVPNPIPGEWGDFSLVRQYMHTLRWCLENFDFDWLMTITGLTYPIKPLQDTERELVESGYDVFCRHFDPFAENHWPPGTAKERYYYQYVKLPKFRYWHRVPSTLRSKLSNAREILNRLQSLVRIMPMPRYAATRLGLLAWQRPFGPHFPLRCGSQNLTLRKRAITAVFNFLDNNYDYIEYFQRTLIPDEAFFLTILNNDSTLRIKNDRFRYVYWPHTISSSPTTITLADLPRAMDSGAPFALKFDEKTHPESLQYLDIKLGIPQLTSSIEQ